MPKREEQLTRAMAPRTASNVGPTEEEIIEAEREARAQALLRKKFQEGTGEVVKDRPISKLQLKKDKIAAREAELAALHAEGKIDDDQDEDVQVKVKVKKVACGEEFIKHQRNTTHPRMETPSPDAEKKPNGLKRKKVNHACVYCRRSHMTCDSERPCSRCVKRNIGHLCHDEIKDERRKSPKKEPIEETKEMAPPAIQVAKTSIASPENTFMTEFSSLYDTTLFGMHQDPFSQFASEHTNSEFLVLSDFLNIMGDTPIEEEDIKSPVISAPASRRQSFAKSSLAMQEKFFLTAADPIPESPEERLKQVINAKVEAGLMKPFNYVRGYARLQKFMDSTMSPDSRTRILTPLSTFRPAFRGITKRLKDVDLILVEEAFERLLLDYDRVFTSMSLPACLWRRTGEIFRGNKEFAALLGLDVEMLRDGKLAITELMAEDSAVNYWEKYGNIAFDGLQKAVLTSCLLNARDGEVVSCCFSFTIKRDRYGVPSAIVGNFLPIRTN